jgi:hypothetical protein
MTLSSLRSRPTLFRFRIPLLDFVGMLDPKHAGRALLRSLRESRARAAAKAFKEFAHLIAGSEDIVRGPSARRE